MEYLIEKGEYLGLNIDYYGDIPQYILYETDNESDVRCLYKGNNLYGLESVLYNYRNNQFVILDAKKENISKTVDKLIKEAENFEFNKGD